MVTVKDFWASWCVSLKMMNPIVAELEKEFEGKAIFEKINVDENGGEAGKYGVMSIPTYVMEKNGKEVDRLIGGRSKEAFKRWIESHI